MADGSDSPIPGVNVSDDGALTATTGGDGVYTITGVITGTYTITSTKSGYTFLPTSRTVPVPPDASGQDFIGMSTDATPPATITNLSASTGSALGTVDLSWTAPGDDGNSGTASTYVVRYNITPISDANWNSSPTASGAPAPAPAGTPQGMPVGGLTPGQTYHFAIKTQDEVPNTSGISNSPGASARADRDVTPPAAINNLSASTGAGTGQVNLSWSAPGDDGSSGTADEYDLRYSPCPFDWHRATQVDNPPSPGSAGSAQSMSVHVPFPGQIYCFGVKTADDEGNWSSLSNVAQARSGEPADTTPPGPISRFHGDAGHKGRGGAAQLDGAWRR